MFLSKYLSVKLFIPCPPPSKSVTFKIVSHTMEHRDSFLNISRTIQLFLEATKKMVTPSTHI